jgi:hypothetical protein
VVQVTPAGRGLDRAARRGRTRHEGRRIDLRDARQRTRPLEIADPPAAILKQGRRARMLRRRARPCTVPRPEVIAMPRLLVPCLLLAVPFAGGCGVDAPVSARLGELTPCGGESGLECTYAFTDTVVVESSTGGASGASYPDLPPPGTTGATLLDPTYTDPTYGSFGTTYLDPTYTDPTYGSFGTTYLDPTYTDPTYGSFGTTYLDPTDPNPTYGTTYDPTQVSSGTTYPDPTQADPTGTTYADPTYGTYGTYGTYDPTGMTTAYETGDESGTDTDDTTGAPPNPCSEQCPFAVGEGLPAMVPKGSKLPFVQGCKENGAPDPVSTSAIVTCLTNVACHLGRNPSKMEALQALGLGPGSMLGSSVIFSTSSDSAQPIPNAPKAPATGVHAVRSISASFSEGAPWCSFTSLADDNSLECMNIGFIDDPFETCGTEPVGIQFDELCEKLDATTTAPASDAVFKSLAATAIDGGQDSCSVCHDQLGKLKAQNGKQCYFFPVFTSVVLCPTKALAPFCTNPGDTATCADQSQPRCPSGTQVTGSTATCNDGKAATCPGPKDATCQVHRGVFGSNQTLASNFQNGSLCTMLKQIGQNAKKEVAQGPAQPWTDTSFIDAYIAEWCK